MDEKPPSRAESQDGGKYDSSKPEGDLVRELAESQENDSCRV